MTDINNDSNTIAPSTPSWINRQRRQTNRRGYGRRQSGIGSSTGGRRKEVALFGTVSRSGGSSLNFEEEDDELNNKNIDNEDEEEEVELLDQSAHARLQGRGRRPPRPKYDRVVDSLDQSAHARLESVTGHASNSKKGELDLIDEFNDGMSKPKKKRPNLPRPPRATRAASKASSASSSLAFSAPNAEANVIADLLTPSEQFESKPPASSSASASAVGNSRLNAMKPTPIKVGARAGGDAKRSKISYPRRPSTTTAIASATRSAASLFEENVHPNDTTGATNNKNLSSSSGNGTITRRSSRLRKAKRNSISGLSSGLSSMHTNGDASCSEKTSITTRTRSRTKANSKKRSATSATGNAMAALGIPPDEEPDPSLEPSPPKIATRSASPASFSSGSFSGSNSSIRNATDSGGSLGSESFSSLARKSFGQNNWASNKGAAKKSYHHKRSVTDSVDSSALKTPSGPSPSMSMHHRSISCGVDLSSSVGNMSFLSPSPEAMGTTTPSVGSSSSRKRRAMFTSSSPLNEEPDFLGGSERNTRSRQVPPLLPFEMDQHAISELRPPALKTATSEPVFMMSPPVKSSYGKHLNSDLSFLGSDDDADEKKEEVRDRPSSDNDESMMSTETDDEDGSTCSSSSEEVEDSEDETPREMTDLETFESKSSHDDFRFLTRELQKWSQSSHGKGASMGLNNGCLIAVPPKWTFEHRASFAKWVAMSFGFRVLSVGGAGCGSFLRCSDAEGKDTLVRLRRILNEYKAGRLAVSNDESNVAADSKSIKNQNGKCPEEVKRNTKLPMKLSSKRMTSSSKDQGTLLPLAPYCDDFDGDILAERMKGISLDVKKPAKSPAVSRVIRSMKLKPLASRLKNTTLPCFRNNSPTMEDGRKSNGNCGRLSRLSSESAIGGSDFINQLHGNSGRPSAGCGRRLLRLSSESALGGSDFINQLHGNGGRPSSGGGRPPRLSSESAMDGSDLISQLHGVGSPSPMPSRFPQKLRRALQPMRRPSLESLHTSFDLPSNSDCLKPFESPHPRNNALATPSSRLEFCLETPMPKQSENWGSRPIFGKDWGESLCCFSGIIDTASQIFAKSWFTSEFYGNDDLSSQYRMALDDGDESYLFRFYNTDADLDNEIDDDADSELASINGGSFDESPIRMASKKIGFARCDSVGASAMDLLRLDDIAKDFCQSPSYDRRRTMTLRKYARMSLCVAAADFRQPKLKHCQLSDSPTIKRSLVTGPSINNIVETTAFSRVLSFLNEGELVHYASLVCTSWADESSEALGNLMLVSVGCDPSSHGKADDDSSSEASESYSVDEPAVPPIYSSVAKSMERDWPYLMNRFPWAKFLADGAFKRVFKVWNKRCRGYEALSVMDVDAIEDLGNSDLVGTELAVSVLLSSLARRNICPNFVVTRGVFTCQQEPPASMWGCRDDRAPLGDTFDGHTQSCESDEPTLDQCGNYQYIRMELCEHGDVEEFIKNHPRKMLAPNDCRNLLFQMAFALHVAADRFGLKHYDVKLLNFLLQSARDPKFADGEHPHVLLRYGIGSHVFRLRMHPSAAFIAKLADYGTSVMRTDSDRQPVSLGQFTTLENTPPDFLILGNTAEQGYGHDSFGLGLCMLHLFTGHGPYEEILVKVFCPETLKGKLRKIWKSKSHDVIKSVMVDSDEDGMDIEDETLYDTLYRFLVLFGIPKMQFSFKKQGKVWRAINSTLLPPNSTRIKKCPDTDVFNKDKEKFSLADGNDERIADARYRLQEMDGAMELLLSLVSFDPKTRATPLDVINSKFMADLVEDDSSSNCEGDIVKSFTAYLAN